MYKDCKVIIVVPAGRERYLKILIPYLLNQKIVDECHFWYNPWTTEDVSFLKQLQNNFIKIVECDENLFENPRFLPTRIGAFLSLAPNDKNIIYIRIDDDICFIEKNAIFNLVKFRYENPEYFLVYGNIVNNLRIDHLHQSLCNKFAQLPPIDYFQDGYLRYSGEFTAQLHQIFIDDIYNDKSHEYFFENHNLPNCDFTSINCISYFANEAFQAYNSNVNFCFEEVALTSDYPLSVGKINAICGNAIFCHFSFYTVREYLEKNTDLIKNYKSLSEWYLK